jgi:hypothetical protein
MMHLLKIVDGLSDLKNMGRSNKKIKKKGGCRHSPCFCVWGHGIKLAFHFAGPDGVYHPTHDREV